MSEISVTRLAVTAIKGTRLDEVESVLLDERGAVGNRRFFVIDERDRMVNAKALGELQQIVASVSGDELVLTLPDGESVRGPIELGGPVTVRFFSRTREARPVAGPFSEAFSRVCGQELRLVEGSAVDRGLPGGVSLISGGSLARLAAQAERDAIDPRRFRMLFEIDGVAAHAEDGWVGRIASVGGARIRFEGHVGRCLVTSRDPESGEIDLPTLDLLRDYRDGVDATEALPFGIYGRVLAPGEVRVGDPVVVE